MGNTEDMNNAHKIATQIADTFNKRLAPDLRNDSRYATYAEDIRVSYDVINDIFTASIQDSTVFSAGGTGVDSALGKLLKLIENWIAQD